MNTPVKSLEERVVSQKERVAACQAVYDEAAQLAADLRGMPKDGPGFALAQRQLGDADTAAEITTYDLDTARRELTHAYAEARQQIRKERWAVLTADVQAVEKAFKVFVAATTRLDVDCAALGHDLGGNAELVPIANPVPYTKERFEFWRAAMSAEGLL